MLFHQMHLSIQRLLATGACALCCLACRGARAAEGESTITLDAFTSGAFRWKDVGDNLYSAAFQSSYSYTQAVVQISFTTNATLLHGTLAAANLKPNFAYHVLWGNWQGTPSANDGAMVWHTFAPDPAVHSAYDTDYPSVTRGVFGEWERLPKGKIYLAAGAYSLDFLITEESFHDSGLGGYWAHALHGAAAFTIVRPQIAAAAHPAHGGTLSIGAGTALDCGASTNIVITPAAYWEIADVAVDGVSRGAVASWTFAEVVSNRTIHVTFAPLLATNGVPQWWLAARKPAWAGDFDAAALADPDGDGQPTWAEYRAGTDPLDGASRFEIASADVHSGRCRLVWMSPLGDPALPPFVILRSTNLVDWSAAGEAARSADGTNAWREAAPPAAAGMLFYRLAAP